VKARNGKTTKWLMPCPLGFEGEENVFKDTCLLVSLVQGKWFRDSQQWKADNKVTGRKTLQEKFQEKRKKLINAYVNRADKLSVGAGKCLKEDITRLATEIGINPEGPHVERNDIIKRVSELFKTQIIVYTQNRPPKINFMYPLAWDVTLPAIHLILTLHGDLEVNDHVDFIKNLEVFFNVRGMPCFEPCGAAVKNYKLTRHKCKTFGSCFACHRFIQTDQTFICPSNKFLFCDQILAQENFEERCPNCNICFKSRNCKKGHSRYLCLNKGYSCSLCGKFDTGITSVVKEKHVCRDYSFCRACREELTDTHICKFGPPRRPRQFPNLGFIHFKSTSCQAQCLSCFALETADEKGLCDLHQSQDAQPRVIFCGVAVERNRRECFEKFFIQDAMFSQPPFPVSNETVRYLPDPAVIGRDMSKIHTTKRTGRYRKPEEKKDDFLELALQTLGEKAGKTVVEMLLHCLLSESYRNYTFVLSSDSYLQEILNALITNNFSVDRNLIIKETRVIFLPVKSFGISFICSTEFLDAPWSDLQKQFGLGDKRPFFPQALCNTSGLALETVDLPPLDHFLELSDSPELVEEKTEHWRSLAGQKLNLHLCLQEVCLSELDIHLKSCLALLDTSFNFELDLLEVFGKPELLTAVHAPLLHLYSFVTLGSYVHDTFRLFSLGEHSNLFTVKAPKKTNVSVGEIEYTSYLNFCHKGEYITAFSSDRGQHRITHPKGPKHPSVQPDAFGTGSQAGKLHFFNGCW
jgi:hypothetical protein